MNKSNFYLMSFIVFMVMGCAVSEETTKKDSESNEIANEFTNEVNLDLEKTISWVNLMPGDEPKFHLSGKFALLRSDAYDFEESQLKYIKVFQDDKELYYIMPKVLEENSGNDKTITYSTIQGLALKREMEIKKPIMLELIFEQGAEELKYRINNIMIEEVH